MITKEILKDLLIRAWKDGREAGNLELSGKFDSNRAFNIINELCDSVEFYNPLTINEVASLYGKEVQYEYQDCIDENLWHKFKHIVDYQLLEKIAKGEIRNVIKLR